MSLFERIVEERPERSGAVKVGMDAWRKANKNQIPGGEGHKLKPKDVDPAELKRGIAVEMEHTTDREIAKEIALDHLAEDPKYYTKLKKIHEEAMEFALATLVWESDAGQRDLERKAAQGDKRAQAKLDRAQKRSKTGSKFTKHHIRKFSKPGKEVLDVESLRRELRRIPKPVRNAINKALDAGVDPKIPGRYPVPAGSEVKALVAFVRKHFDYEEKQDRSFAWPQPWGGIEDAPDDHWNSTVVKVKRVGKILGPILRGNPKHARKWTFVPSRFFYEHLDQLRALLTEAVGTTPYIGVFLTPQSQAKLKKAIPPAFNNKSGNHLTIKFAPSEEDMAKFQKKIGKKVTLTATHLIQTADYQAIRLSNTVKVERGYPHITIAWREGSSPAKGNRAMKENKGAAIQPWLKLQGIYDTFPRSLSEALERTIEDLGL